MSLMENDIAATVRAEMARQGRKQKTLAESLGISQPALSKRLSGDVPFSAIEIAKVAAFLDVPVAALLGVAA